MKEGVYMKPAQKQILLYLIISFILMIGTLFLCDFLYTNKILFYSEDLIIDSIIKVFGWAIIECFLLDPIVIAIIGCSIAWLHKKGKDKVKIAVIMLLNGTSKKTILFIWIVLIVTSIISVIGLGGISGFCGLFSLLSIPVSVFYTTFWFLIKRSNYDYS